MVFELSPSRTRRSALGMSLKNVLLKQSAAMAMFFQRSVVCAPTASDLGSLSLVQGKLKHIEPRRTFQGAEADDCREMIEEAISTSDRDLAQRLKYSDEEAIDILACALACYLDERYSITNRPMLGIG